MDAEGSEGRPSFFRKPAPPSAGPPLARPPLPPPLPPPPTASAPPAPGPAPGLPRPGEHPLRHPRRQRAADDRHHRDLLLLGQDARPRLPRGPERVRGRPLRLSRNAPRAADGHHQGGAGLRCADPDPAGGPRHARRAARGAGGGRAPGGGTGLRLLPDRDGGRAALPAQPDLVARDPLLVPGAGGGAAEDLPARQLPHRADPRPLLSVLPGVAPGVPGVALLLRRRALRLLRP